MTWWLLACTGAEPEKHLVEETPQHVAARGGGFYHLSQGSEPVPWTLFSMLERADSDERFADDLERFGLLSDPEGPDNPFGLPVGLTVSEHEGGAGLYVGHTCAACHVGEFTVGDQTVRVDGAPGLFQSRRLYSEYDRALQANLDDPAKFGRLLARYVDAQDAVLEDARDALDAELRHFDDVKTHGPSRHLAAEFLQAHRSPGGPRTVQDFGRELRLALASKKYIDAYHGTHAVPFTAPGPGRVDAFGAVRVQVLRQTLGDAALAPMNAPASIPHLWDVENTRWLHWMGNTNSAMERNLVEAVGSGAVIDFETWESWAKVRNLAQLEAMTYAFEPVPWPWGPLDSEKVARGEELFAQECAACHGPRPTEMTTFPRFSLEEIGTDPTHSNNWETPVDGVAMPELVSQLGREAKGAYATRFQVPQDEQRAWERGLAPDELVFRSTADAPLAGRPLTGVWATAPYLHNGSVPSLYDLLLPPDQRPRTFPLGHREFDTDKVGFTQDVQDPVWVYDVDAPVLDPATGDAVDVPNGNGNGGHVYGTTLPLEDRLALVEYLKTL